METQDAIACRTFLTTSCVQRRLARNVVFLSLVIYCMAAIALELYACVFSELL